MLTKIILKNICSIKECEIDFSKNRYSYLEENVLDGLVNPIAVYGHNGSGKTSIFRAISTFINLMVRPVDDLNGFIINEFNLSKFKKNNHNNLLPPEEAIKLITGSMEIHFKLDNDNYVYFLATNLIWKIEKEYLLVNGREVFLRDIETEKYENKIIKLDINRSRLVPTLRYLASKEVDDLSVQKAYKFLSSFTFVDLPRQSSGSGFVTSKLFDNVKIFDLIVAKSDGVKDILRDYAEFPLYSVIKKENTENLNNNAPYMIKYEGMDDEELDYRFMSDGMRNQSVLLSIVLSLPENGILFVDEVDDALHPSAAVSFLKVIREKKIQLLFSSHNTHLLQHLRPDQIYFAKWKQGYSSYYRLSNIYPNIREINNIEKMYLANVFEVED